MDSTGAGGLSCHLLVLVLIVFSILSFQSMAVDDASGGSLFLIDSPTHPYLRSPPHQAKSMSAMEVAAAVSILLGRPPSPMLSAATSAKLNELLLPNPFDRPRRVFLLEIGLAQDMVYPDIGVFTNAIKSNLVRDADTVEIELPEIERDAYFSLGGPDYGSYFAITDEDLSDFASSFGGSYKSDKMEPINGELLIPLPSGAKMSLHLSKKSDRKFATGMVYLIKMTKELSEINSYVAQLLGDHFDGIKALQEDFKSEEIAQQAIELLFTALSKVVDNLQDIFEGEIVTVVLFNKVHSSLPQRVLDVTYMSRPSSRFLEEKKSSSNSTAEAEVALVRRTLAWVTGVVLIIATLIGVFLLLNMPLTRDTLLYSNVKLD